MALTYWSVNGAPLTGAQYDANLEALALPTRQILTISSGIITIPSLSSPTRPAPGIYYVLPESGTADDLTQINGGVGWEELITLRTNTVGHIITVVHNGTNICMATSSFLLNTIKDHISFRCRSTNVWVENDRISIPA